MISCASVQKRAIQTHYDLATPFYRLLWGVHIHHGLWDADEPPSVAQQQLIDRLAETAGLRGGERVLDVGCGIGGTSIDLARRLGCRVTGVTLSPVQQAWASVTARWQGVGRRVRFLRRDAETISLPPASFDVVWSVECTEHFFDKPGFFRRAAGWLTPGGRVAICAWLAGDGPLGASPVLDVCEYFLCPSLGTVADYQGWMTEAGLRVTTFDDLTVKVARTWDVCRQRVRHPAAQLAARLLGRPMYQFLTHFDTLVGAFRNGAMRYGLFVAAKPLA